jgi:hypothetical protein
MEISFWIRRIMILFAVLLSGSTWAVANSDQSQAASALFSEFETVFYAKADFLLTSGGYKGLSEERADSLRVPFADLQGALDSLGTSISGAILHNSEAVLVGAKDFRSPAGLGGVHSKLCYIAVLRSGTFDFGVVASKSRVMSLAGESTWKWITPPTESQREGETFYATQVGHSYFLASNDASELQATVANLATSDAQIVRGLREWEVVSQHALWGYRRYRQTEANQRDAAGLTDVTPTAKSLIFYFDSEKKSGVLRLLATDGSTPEKMNATEKLPMLKPISSDVWQTNIPLLGDKTSSEQMLAVMWLFGFGLYL